MRFRYRRYYLYYLGRTLAFIISILPLKTGLYIAKVLGDIAFLAAGKYRKIAVENLRLAFGNEKTEAEIRDIAKRVFENLARNAVELVNFPKINKDNIDELVEFRNREILDKELRKGNGVIVLTAHFGNWELLSGTLRIKDYAGVAIGRRIYFDKYDKYLNSLRKIQDVNIIYRDESPRKVLKVLKSNGIVGILADQDVDSVEGVFVNFFNAPAYTPIGPVALAKASGASIVPLFIIREGARHILTVEKPIELVETEDKSADMVNNTQAWSRIVESYIRRYPDHWVWVHRRWKTGEKPQSHG